MAGRTPSTGAAGTKTTGTRTPDDDALAALLRAGDPWRSLSPAQMALREDDMADALAGFGAAGTRAPRRRWRRLVLVGAGTAALALTAFMVRGGGWTGEYATGTPDGMVWQDGVASWNAHGTDTSEFISPAADGGLETVASLAPREFPLPTWVTWDAVVDHQVAQLSAQGSSVGTASAEAFRSGYIYYAETAWKTRWVEAYEAGDAAAQAEALVHWRAALDENHDSVYPPQAQIPYERLADAERGDVAAVRHELEINGDRWITARIGITSERSHG